MDEIPTLAQVIIAVCAVLGAILALHRANIARFKELLASNSERFSRIDLQLTHQDTCLDSLRASVTDAMLKGAVEARSYVQRTDLEIELGRIRSALGLEVRANTESITRILSDISDVKSRISAVEALQRTNIRRISEIMERDDK